jgi:hypothetical protein
MAGSQSSVRRFISMVRLALVTSVTCLPVRFQINHVSMLPNNSSPRAAFLRAPGMLSSSQVILGPEKYVASGSPTRF